MIVKLYNTLSRYSGYSVRSRSHMIKLCHNVTKYLQAVKRRTHSVGGRLRSVKFEGVLFLTINFIKTKSGLIVSNAGSQHIGNVTVYLENIIMQWKQQKRSVPNFMCLFSFLWPLPHITVRNLASLLPLDLICSFSYFKFITFWKILKTSHASHAPKKQKDTC